MKPLLKILSYPLSVLFYLLFGLGLLFYDVVQRIALILFGYSIHKNSVDIFNATIVRTLHILGTRFSVEMPKNLPVGKPVIIASNHQSMWDIPPLIWFLRKLHVKFISKIELGKGIPSISYNLRKGGSVLIDRKDSIQATQQIEKIATYISKNKRAVVIFPEGTRSRNGQPKPFRPKGLTILFEQAPTAVVLPVSISNSWKLQRFGLFPMPLGVHFKMKVHEPLIVANYEQQNLLQLVEKTVLEGIEND
ncbi:1-acyl-sn-glycerol-3-phosphate acyltransferase [Rasiella rasia]|uniref:1-acyl-sn-glycerol-3-phosphate acyltransferase n=1 Tax=Rasiella rasia TaxID=2744027 RepID=A0A6G6GNL1_9FLAO|nr:lysophospholipid acyltransferase family protein [Rasiella rasia]QIE60003.1 1-acyl-sn-glycerol-3-phosphate acyltransferase [Rasiella rasia]